MNNVYEYKVGIKVDSNMLSSKKSKSNIEMLISKERQQPKQKNVPQT